MQALQPKQCSLKVGEVPLKQSVKFKYLVISFTSDGRQNSELELDIRNRNASAVMRQLHGSEVLKRELCAKANLFILRSAYVPNLTYCHECWIMNKKVRSRVKAAEMFFCEELVVGFVGQG